MAALALVLLLLQESIPFFLEKLNKELDQAGDALKHIERLGERFKRIKPQIEAAELLRTDGSAKIFLEDIKVLVYDFEDLLEEWLTSSSASAGHHYHRSTSKKEVWADSHLLPSCSCFGQFAHRHSLGGRIMEIDDRLKNITNDYLLITNYPRVIATEERPQFSSMVDRSHIRGRDREKDDLVHMLMNNNVDDEIGVVGMSNPGIVSITGMTGIGKTALAQFVFNDELIQNHFEYKIWVPVSNPISDKKRLAKAIIEAIEEEIRKTDRKNKRKEVPEFFEWNPLHHQLRKSLSGKRFLLVLDDVTGIDIATWDELKLCLGAGAVGSRVLVTTQIKNLATMMGSNKDPYILHRISDEDCWLLLSDTALPGKKEEEIKKLEREGRELAKKCQGLPLAVKSIGSFMRNKTRKQEWQDVITSDVWNLDLVRESLLRPLFFSYYALTPELRRCFGFCAFLPNDYQINKSILIKQWMAQGFLGKGVDDQMERTGEGYFHSLVTASFLQYFKDGGDHENTVNYKLHHHVHAFAQFHTGIECYFMENSTCSSESIINCSRIRHTTLIFRDENVDSIPPSLYQAENLRSLKLLKIRWKLLTKIPPEVFHRFRLLRTLDLSYIGLKELSSNVEELILLRFLDLSGSSFASLPNTLCNLKNLQTLILNDCEKLTNLPRRIVELITLRHLEIENTPLLMFLPEGIWRLTALRTLSKFIVAAPGSSKGSKIGELKPLNLLEGHLQIDWLKRVKRGSDAKEAELEKKNQLRSVCLDFGIDVLRKPQTVEVMEVVLEGLLPNSRLEKLELHHYLGSNFSSWMMMMDSTLNNLRSLTLKDCNNCTQVPPLGKLPFLEEVRIENLDGVEDIGIEFYGIITENGVGCVEGTFLKLKVLHIDGMENLRTWNWIVHGDRVSMPSLRHLFLKRCPRLEALPRNIFPLTLDEQHVSTDCPGLLQIGVP